MKNENFASLESTKKKYEQENIDSLNKEKILCKHCLRTKSNKKYCLGICVADNEY